MSATKPPTGAPDPAALQKLLTDLQAKVKDLLAKLPAAPLPLPLGHSSGPVSSVPHALPVPLSVEDALAKVVKDLQDLVAAVTAVPPNPSGVTSALTALVTDTLAVLTSIVPRLGGV